jgi:hypothetical protein
MYPATNGEYLRGKILSTLALLLNFRVQNGRMDYKQYIYTYHFSWSGLIKFQWHF